MNNRIVTIISLMLVLSLAISSFTGCSKVSIENTSSVSANVLSDGNFVENFFDEYFTKEDKISEQFVEENITYEDGVYECIVNEDTICETYVIETTVTENAISEIRKQLPEHFEEYDIDWKKVIGKFAVGTSIIIAVGVVDYATQGNARFIFGTPIGIAKDAFVTAATFSAINATIGTIEDGRVSQKAKKYAIEGFADGFMWGAIGSALKVPVKNIANKKGLVTATGEVVEVKSDSSVISQSGKMLGYMRYGKGKAYLVEGTYAASRIIKVFGKNGKELVGKAAYEKKALIDAAGRILFTDSTGAVFKEGKKLLPKISYELNRYKYQTDKMGRIKSAEGNLRLEQCKRSMGDSISDVANGDNLPGDHRGHIFAHIFGGADEIGNLVAMDGKVNLGEYKALETLWKNALKDGKKVKVNIKLKYNGTNRPTKFKINYWIDGKRYTKVIRNGV